MTIRVQPLPQAVQKAVERNTSAARHVGPALGWLLHCCMFLAVTGGCAAGTYHLWRSALEDQRFRLDGSTLGLAGSVKQCPESAAELQAIGRRFNGRCLLDPGLVSDIQAVFSQSVWVKSVSRLRRSFPNRIDLELQLRLPAAQVRSNGIYRMVDIEGMVLPVAERDTPFAALPEIVGVAANTIGEAKFAGEVWPDAGVRGALGVMRVFWGSPLSEVLPVARVVVNTGVFRGETGDLREIRRRFDVLTTSGVVIRWGTFNENEIAGDELTSAEKMWHVQELLAQEEALGPGVSLDVRTRLPGYSLLVP